MVGWDVSQNGVCIFHALMLPLLADFLASTGRVGLR